MHDPPPHHTPNRHPPLSPPPPPLHPPHPPHPPTPPTHPPPPRPTTPFLPEEEDATADKLRAEHPCVARAEPMLGGTRAVGRVDVRQIYEMQIRAIRASRCAPCRSGRVDGLSMVMHPLGRLQ